MNFKKTFWLNVLSAISWVLLCLLSFATDIDYVEHTLTHKIISYGIQLCVLVNLIVTACYIYNPNKFLRKLALFGNYCGVIGTVLYVLLLAYKHPSTIISFDFIAVLIIFCLFALPCLINLKAVKAS